MKKKIAALLTVVLAAALLINNFSSSSATSYSSITSDSIREKEEGIKKAEEERKELENSLTNAQNIKKQLEAEKKDLNNYITQLDIKLSEIQDNIARLNEQITQKELDIARTQEELARAREVEAAQYEAMVHRIQYNYEQGDATYWELIFSGESIADILTKVEYMERIAAYDKEQLNEFILNRQLIEVTEQQLLTDMALLEETREGVLAEEAAMEELIQAKQQTIKEYENNIAYKEQAIKEYEADIKERNEIVEALEAAIAEEKKRIMEANGSLLTYDGGQFKFPVASYTRLSSDYGMRLHPTLGVESFHNGIDLASPTGTAIFAAYDGKVVAASYSSTMGNYIMIDHGDNLYTIYMHASKLYVQTGDIVVRGETIAAVGATGRTTGPHLHFSVRLNGEYVSPWNYLSQ